MLHVSFYKKRVFKKMRLKCPKSVESHKAKFPKFTVFIGERSMLRHYCIQNVEDKSQVQAYKINKESVTHFSQFISVKVAKISRKSWAKFQKKLRKLRHWKNNGFLMKKRASTELYSSWHIKSFSCSLSLFVFDGGIDGFSWGCRGCDTPQCFRFIR